MENYLKRYEIILKPLSPIFIGSGEKIGKKEYVYDTEKNTVYIFDFLKLYDKLRQERLADRFESYLLEEDDILLQEWFEKNKIGKGTYKKWAEYKIDSTYAKCNKYEIELFIRDPYGKVYVPGSSLKGAIRTALLAWELEKRKDLRKNLEEVCEDIEKINQEQEDLKKNLEELIKKLNQEMQKIENEVFHTRERTDNKKDAVNDIFSGIYISDSDSKPAKGNMVLCQKCDKLKEKRNLIPIFRECIKPDPRKGFRFTMTINEKEFPYTTEEILEAIDRFAKKANGQYDKFKDQKGNKYSPKHEMFLGGNAGYISKTIAYNLFKEEDAIRHVANIMQAKFPEHKHEKDSNKGVSPHTISIAVNKEQQQNIEFWNIGRCEIAITENKRR